MLIPTKMLLSILLKELAVFIDRYRVYVYLYLLQQNEAVKYSRNLLKDSKFVSGSLCMGHPFCMLVHAVF